MEFVRMTVLVVGGSGAIGRGVGCCIGGGLLSWATADEPANDKATRNVQNQFFIREQRKAD